VKDYWSCYAFNFVLFSVFFFVLSFFPPVEFCEEINVVVACKVSVLFDTLKIRLVYSG